MTRGSGRPLQPSETPYTLHESSLPSTLAYDLPNRFCVSFADDVANTVNACLEVSEMSGNWQKVGEMPGISFQGKLLFLKSVHLKQL